MFLFIYFIYLFIFLFFFIFYFFFFFLKRILRFHILAPVIPFPFPWTHYNVFTTMEADGDGWDPLKLA